MIGEILKHIPWYVYVLLYILVVRGVKALKDNQISLKKVLILPVVMNIWVIIELQQMFGFQHLTVLMGFGLSLVVGAGFGWYLIRGKAFWGENGVLLRGNPVTLILVLSIFIAKFSIFTWSGFHPELWLQTWFVVGVIAVFGIIAGISLGRLIYILRIIQLKITLPQC